MEKRRIYGVVARPVIFLLSTSIFREAVWTNVFDVKEETERNARKCWVKVKLGDPNSNWRKYIV